MTWTPSTEHGSEGGAFELQLLRSARFDTVPPEARARAARRLGISLNAAATPAWSKSRLFDLSALGKYTLLAVLGGVAPLSSEAAQHAPEPAVAISAAPAEPSPQLPTVVVPPPSSIPTPTPIPTRMEARTPEARASRPRPMPSRRTASESALMEEVRRIDAIQGALNANQPSRALALLDAYDARFKRGSLAREAAALRARAEERSPARPRDMNRPR